MYRWALRPRWILSHLFVVALVATMVLLGFWQLQRLDERQASNARIEQRAQAPVVAIASVAQPDDPLAVGDELDYRAVRAAGTYLPDGEVRIRNRTLDGRPGYWVVTPLVLDEGDAVLVNRGWIPFSGDEDADLAPAPPAGRVEVTGVARRTQEARGLAAADPAEGTLAVLNRVDIARIARQSEVALLPVYVQELPDGGGDLPLPVGLPPLDDGPHFSYAMQWFIFATIGAGGYLLFLRRHAREPSEPPPPATPWQAS